MKENPWINRILSAVFAISMGVSSWFLNQTMTTMKDIESRVHTIEIQNAGSKAVAFTNSDWQIARALIEADKLQTEKRIIVLEQSIPTIKESLIRIERMVERSNGQASN